MPARDSIRDALIEHGLMAVLRLKDPGPLRRVAEALHEGGVRAIEIPLNTPGAIEAIAECVPLIRDSVIGAGNVITAEQAEEAVRAGAEFIASPGSNADLIRAVHGLGKAVVVGAYSFEEIGAAMELDADLIRLFPANSLGPDFVREVLASDPAARLMPMGGVTLELIGPYFDAGAKVIGADSELIRYDSVAADDFDALVEAAKAFMAAVDRARKERSP